MSEFEGYKLSEHAIDRLDKRFNVTRSESMVWMKRLFESAKFVKKESGARIKYHTDDISFVLDTRSKIVVTIFPEFQGEQVKTDINPEIAGAINRSMNDLIEYKQKNISTRLVDDMSHLAESFDQTLLDNDMDEFKRVLAEINRKVESNDEVIKQARDIIDHVY